MQSLRCASEVQLLGHRQEGLQLPKFHADLDFVGLSTQSCSIRSWTLHGCAGDSDPDGEPVPPRAHRLDPAGRRPRDRVRAVLSRLHDHPAQTLTDRHRARRTTPRTRPDDGRRLLTRTDDHELRPHRPGPARGTRPLDLRRRPAAHRPPPRSSGPTPPTVSTRSRPPRTPIRRYCTSTTPTANGSTASNTTPPISNCAAPPTANTASRHCRTARSTVGRTHPRISSSTWRRICSCRPSSASPARCR